MTTLDWIAFLWGIPVAGALACRCDVLRFGEHDARAVLMHWAMFVGSLSALFNAVTGNTDLQDFAMLLAFSSWIVLSLPTWLDGKVPSHLRTRPAELDGEQLEQYRGGAQ
jgi:hypothetical protein